MSTQDNAIVDKLLVNISNKIVPEGYISEMILPLVNVKQSSGLLGNYGTSHLRIENDVTGGKNKYPQVSTRVYETQTYNITTHGLYDIVTEKDKANVEQPFDAMIDSTDELTTKLWLGKEKSLADTLTDPSIITQGVTFISNDDQYDNFANSDPILDFITARATIFDAAGMPPDTAVMSWKVWNILRYHPQLLDNLGFKDSRPGGLKHDELAKVLEVKRLLIGTAIFDDAAEGQTIDLQQVWGKHIVFAVAPTKSAKRQVSLGYRFQQFGTPRRVFKTPVNNPPNATQVLVDDSYQQLLSTTNAAYLIENAIA